MLAPREYSGAPFTRKNMPWVPVSFTWSVGVALEQSYHRQHRQHSHITVTAQSQHIYSTGIAHHHSHLAGGRVGRVGRDDGGAEERMSIVPSLVYKAESG